jgi:hypothetical protein
MPAPPLMKVTIAPPSDGRWTELFETLEQNIEIQVPAGFLTGAIVTSLPTSNIGPVLLTTDNQWYIWDTVTLQYLPQLGTGDVGSIKTFAFNQIDLTKYVPCNGAAYPRTTPYDLLYAKIGTTYGNGDGSTTFNVPNMPKVLTILGSGQITLASGVGVINSALITATSIIGLSVNTSSGTIVTPYVVCAAGAATIHGGGSDNSTYNYVIYDIVANAVNAIRFK